MKIARLSLFSAAHIDRRSIKHVLDVRRVVFLDHLDAGATVFRNLIDVGPLHQPETDVGMSQAVAGSRVSLATMFHAEFVEERVEEFTLNLWEQELIRPHAVPLLHPFERNHGTGNRLAKADTTLAANGDV